MAIIQISKIQQRSGNLVDLPQLDEAQFGWASDAKRLFIGKTTPNENIEVLTSYSNISFSQIDGSGNSNVNITSNSLVDGQLLTYVALTNTWENYTGNSSQIGNSKLQLGSASNISITGGAGGYVLETDGIGNLAWTSKGTSRTSIIGLSNATPIVMTVNANVPYVNGLAVTISGANAANANTIVNGETFYVKVGVDFPSTGNVALYTSADLAIGNAAVGTNLGTYTANSGVATALLSGSGTANAGGAVNTIQFNDGGILNGSSNFTITGGNVVSLTGNLSASNINGGNLVTANFFTGTLTTAAQPNITSTGTLASLSVTGNANVGNLNTGGLVTATGNIRGGNLTTGGILSATGNANVGNIGATSGVFTTVTGSLTTAAQPNITSTGTLTSLSVTGNANVGNLNTGGLVTAAGNITGGNVITAGIISATGNLTAGNITTAGIISATGNLTAGNVSGTLVTGTLSTAAQPNITSVGSLTSLNVINDIEANILNITGVASANYFISNVGTGTTPLIIYSTTMVPNLNAQLAGLATYATTANSVAGANVSGQVGNALVAGTVYTAAQPNITSVSTSFSNLTFANAQTISGNNMTLTTGANTNAGTITGNWSLSTGSKLQATYADLAEYYEADAEYEPGTVLAFGGDKEVTIAEDGTTRVAGVVSTNPAYAMNSNCQGVAVAIALQGRVPTKVRGTIRKGDMMVSAGNGFARPWNNPQMGTVIGKALEDFDGVEGIIEVAVGRL
jgi:hypothetical protein